MHRRHFLKSAATCCATLAAVSSSACTHRKFYNPDQDIIIGGGRFKKSGEIRNVLAIANLEQKDTQLVETDFLPHETLVDPKDKRRIITFEKNGNHAAAIDLNDNQVITHFSPERSNRFSGYGSFNQSGDMIYDIESDIETATGKILIRDSKSFQAIASIPSYGKNPLACQLINQQLIAVANCGSADTPASITYIDIQSDKLVEEIMVGSNRFNSCYFSISNRGNLIVTTSPEDSDQTSHVAISDEERTLFRMDEPEALTGRLFGGADNICIDERHDIAAITHPRSNLLTFWSINERKLHKAMSVPNPRGIALSLDRKKYIVSYGIDTNSILIRTRDLVADRTTIMQPTYTTGQHIINWSSTLRQIMPQNVYG